MTDKNFEETLAKVTHYHRKYLTWLKLAEDESNILHLHRPLKAVA